LRTTRRAEAAAYLTLGFCHLWVLVIQWGWYEFPGNVSSSAALGGAVTLILVAGPLAFFARRPAALIALVAVAAETCAAGIVFVQPGSPRGLLLLAAIPLVAVFRVAIRAIRHPTTDGAAPAVERPFVSAAVVVVAYAVFFAVFDGALLLGLLFGWKQSR
jgi:hypothetical protein